LDSKLDLFTSDKFLSGVSGSASKSLTIVAEKVLLHHEINNENWLKAIIVALTHNEVVSRNAALSAVKRLGNVLGGQ
jgi:hypothetical protein